MTIGLKDDPELRLDVKHELANHLEETAEGFVAEGQSEAESRDMALKVLGSPVELADELAAANRRRMRQRALARLLVRSLLAPAAVLLALIIGYGGLARVQHILVRLNQFRGVEAPVRLPYLDLETLLSPIERTRRFPTADDLWLHREESAQRLARLWEQHRGDSAGKGYLALYAGYLCSQGDGESARTLLLQGTHDDPGNAWYYYHLAVRDYQRGHDTREPTALFTALRQPHCRLYLREVLHDQYRRLPAPRLTEDYLRQVEIADAITGHLAQYTCTPALAGLIPDYATRLIAAGEPAQAERVLRNWRRLPAQLVAGATGEAELRLAGVILDQCGPRVADLFDRLGRYDDARRARADTRRYRMLFAPLIHPPDDRTAAKRYGGVLASTLTPAYGRREIDAEEYIPARLLAYTLFEQCAVDILLVLLTVLIIGTLGVLWRYLWRLRRSAVMPLLLLPTWHTGLRIAFLGLLLPLAVFYLYSHWSGLAGREHSFESDAVMWLRLTIEHSLLGAALIGLPTAMIVQRVWARCRFLGIAVPSGLTERMLFRQVFGMATLPIAFVGILSIGGIALVMHAYWLAGLIFLLIVVLAVWAERRNAAQQPAQDDCVLYRGTIARSLLPIYAVAILLIAAATQPYLLHSEMTYLRQDRVMFPHQQASGLTPAQLPLVRKLKVSLERALDDSRATSPTE